MTGGALVLDANLLVLFIVGSTRPDLIGRHKRLKAFTVEDSQLLWDLVGAEAVNFNHLRLGQI